MGKAHSSGKEPYNTFDCLIWEISPPNSCTDLNNAKHLIYAQNILTFTRLGEEIKSLLRWAPNLLGLRE